MENTNTAAIAKESKIKMNAAQVKSTVLLHKKAANHFDEAAKHHTEAAKHVEAGNHEKAEESTVKAHGHHSLAAVAQKEAQVVPVTSH